MIFAVIKGTITCRDEQSAAETAKSIRQWIAHVQCAGVSFSCEQEKDRLELLGDTYFHPKKRLYETLSALSGIAKADVEIICPYTDEYYLLAYDAERSEHWYQSIGVVEYGKTRQMR